MLSHIPNTHEPCPQSHSVSRPRLHLHLYCTLTLTLTHTHTVRCTLSHESQIAHVCPHPCPRSSLPSVTLSRIPSPALYKHTIYYMLSGFHDCAGALLVPCLPLAIFISVEHPGSGVFSPPDICAHGNRRPTTSNAATAAVVYLVYHCTTL